MANAVYPTYKGFILTASANISLDQNTVNDGPYVSLIDLGVYTYDGAHDFYNDITGVIGTTQRITAPTVAAASGTFDGADVTFTEVSGASVEAIVIYRHNSGANTTWKLVLFEDTGVTGLPVTPNGGDITITWSGSGIFTISDLTEKENVEEIGALGVVPLYEYSYRDEERMRVGVMAQDVEKILPAAVVQFGKRKAVDYRRVIDYALAA